MKAATYKYAILVAILAVPAAAQNRAAEIDFQNRLQDSDLTRAADGCACGAVGKCDGTAGLLDFVAGLIASSAHAADIPKRDDGAREYSNAHGDFLIVPRKSAPRSAGSGIGVRVVKKGADLTISEVFKGSPAEEAGLVQGDTIISIDGRPAAKLGLPGAGMALRGKANSLVRLSIRRKTGETKRLEIARSDSAFSAVAPGAAVSFLAVPSRGKAACAPKEGECVFLYTENDACHYTCRKPVVGQ